MASQNTATKIWEAFLANKSIHNSWFAIQDSKALWSDNPYNWKIQEGLPHNVINQGIYSKPIFESGGIQLRFGREQGRGTGIYEAWSGLHTPWGKNNKEALFIRDEANLAGMLTPIRFSNGRAVDPVAGKDEYQQLPVAAVKLTDEMKQNMAFPESENAAYALFMATTTDKQDIDLNAKPRLMMIFVNSKMEVISNPEPQYSMSIFKDSTEETSKITSHGYEVTKNEMMHLFGETPSIDNFKAIETNGKHHLYQNESDGSAWIGTLNENGEVMLTPMQIHELGNHVRDAKVDDKKNFKPGNNGASIELIAVGEEYGKTWAYYRDHANLSTLRRELFIEDGTAVQNIDHYGAAITGGPTVSRTSGINMKTGPHMSTTVTNNPYVKTTERTPADRSQLSAEQSFSYETAQHNRWESMNGIDFDQSGLIGENNTYKHKASKKSRQNDHQVEGDSLTGEIAIKSTDDEKFSSELLQMHQSDGIIDGNQDVGLDASGFDSFLLQSNADVMAPFAEPFADAAAITDLVTGKSSPMDAAIDPLVAAGPLDAVKVDEPRNNDF